jgi:hypothetical protein
LVEPLCHVIRLPIRAGQMMYSRMRSYRALLVSGALKGPALFLDTDVCLNRDFRPLFDGTFDVGLTYRVDPAFLHMPLNEGVIIAAETESDAAANFFGLCLDNYGRLASEAAVTARYPFDVRMWRGGQLALGAFVDWRVPPDRPISDTIAGIRCRFLPCDEFNFAVTQATTEADLVGKWAIHFKGGQKEKMTLLLQQSK